MADPWHHAISSARRHGGKPEDYYSIHKWFDGSKAMFCDQRHRALRHHAEGIGECINLFGSHIIVCGKAVPTRWIGEQHISEDLGRIPNLSDWLKCIQTEKWMVSRNRDLTKI